MGNRPESTTTRTWLKNEQVRFGLVLAGLAAVAILVIVSGPRGGLEVGKLLGDVLRGLEGRHRAHALKTVQKACRRKDCACLEAAARAALDVDAGSLANELLDAGPTCKAQSLSSMRSEALVRTGATQAGRERANAILMEHADDPYAHCAVGLTAYREGAWQLAASALTRAVTAGRGDGAELALGVARYFGNDLASAREAFEAILKNEPDDIEALYNLGLVAQKQDHYGEARRLYLGVLRLNPQQQQARYNLAVLTHSIGADMEAEHHLKALEATHPDATLLANLRAELARPPAKRGQVLSLGGPAPSAAPVPAP